MTDWQRLRAADQRWTERLCIAEKPGLLRAVAKFLAHSGDSWFWGLGLAAVWHWGSSEWQRWALSLFSAILVTGLIVIAVSVAAVWGLLSL